MKIDDDDFHPITIEDKKIFDEIYSRYPIEHSENTFGTLYCWRHYGHYEIAVIEGCLIIRGSTDAYTSLRAPIGPKNKEVLDAVIDLALSTGAEAPFLILEPWQYDWIPRVRPDLTFRPDRDFFDYVYKTSDLAGLEGKQYLMIRKQLNKFRKNCPSEVEMVTEKNFDEVRDFLARWCQWRECDKYTILKHEKEALAEGLEAFEQLGFQGIVVKPRGEIAAIAIFEELNPDTAVVHYEKGLPDCEGIYKEINYQTAEHLKNKYSFINRESDMGLPGLKEAKERYHPHHMAELYYVDTSNR
ncbi:MAG TPA: phosphatidylglycerol lysyltransferase domain-containing protein [Methanospirillum sp.]|nr:phosphatidylglycerol lysyltransferase domain-containing protein [Methanospirillum sp.]